MRVSHVITRLIIGGAQENTVSTVLGLHAKPDIQVDLISGLSEGAEGSLQSTFTSEHSLQIVPELVRPVQPFSDIKALKKLTQIFRATKPDIVHTHSGKAGVLGRIAAHHARVPIILHTIHGPSFGSFQGAMANFIFCSAEKYAARYTTHFISVANAMSEQYLAAGIGRREDYTRIFSGFNLSPFLQAHDDLAFRKQLVIAPDDFVVGTVARLVELKGHEDLLNVAPSLVQGFPRIKFLLVGDGPLRQKFQTKIRALKLQNHFIFAGLVKPDEVSRYVGVMDCLVHLSRREGLPRALPQALAAGKPVIAFDCDGAKEICLNNETGFLIAPDDFSDLQQKILHLANDAGLRKQFGKRGQEIVRQNFSVEGMVENIYELYLKLAAAKKLSAR